MKKFLILFLVLLLTLGVLSLSACSLFGEKGDTGAAGVGIASIEKSGTEGLVDTYTITLTDGSTATFTVTNGKDGENGKDGKDGVNAGGTSTDPDAPTPDDYFRFTLLEDDTYEISARYNDMPPRVVIPSTYNGKPVTSIANRAFETHEQLKSCTDEFIIPNSVTTIGDKAFRDCRNMSSITIPDSVTTIGGYAFDGCTGLTSVTIPDSVTSIGSRAFDGCTGLTSVTIPDSVTTIGSCSFSGCTALTEIRYGGDLVSWCANSDLGGVMSSDCVLYINGSKVEGDLVIPSDVTEIAASAFCYCTGLTSVTLDNGVTTIGSTAFRYCTGLTSVTIPSSVTSIGNYAFEDCSGLTSVTYQGTKAQWALIELGYKWANDSNISIIHCTDGDIEL